jgi:hypothetical protein
MMRSRRRLGALSDHVVAAAAADDATVRGILDSLESDPAVRAAVQHEMNLRARNADWLERKSKLAAKVAAAGAEQRAHAERVAGIVEEIHETGFAVVQLLEGERLQRLRDGMQHLFAAMEWLDAEAQAQAREGMDHQQSITPAGRVSNAVNVFAKTSAADDVATDPLLLDVIEGVLGKGVWLSCAHAKNPLPGTGAQVVHRDDGTPGRFNIPGEHPHPHKPIVCNTLLALDDFTAENGGTVIAPGSHVWPVWNFMQHRRPEPADMEHLVMPAGCATHARFTAFSICAPLHNLHPYLRHVSTAVGPLAICNASAWCWICRGSIVHTSYVR